MYKNVASQKLAVLAWDTANDAPKTGDAANITAYIRKDGGTPAATNDTNPTEVDATNMPGVYEFDLTQAETNADNFVVASKSSTADIVLDPVSVYTRPTVATIQSGLSTLDAAGVRSAVGLASANLDTQISGIAAAVWASGTRTLTSFGSLAADAATAVWAAGTRTLTAICDSSGVTSLFDRLTSSRAGYLDKLNVSGTLAHSDAASTYRADVSGLSTLDAAGVRTAVGLATANLDTQLGDVPTVAEFEARTIAAADYATSANLTTVDSVVDGIKATTDKLDDTLEDNAGTYRLTAAALVNAPSGGGGGGDATAANQATIIGHLEDIKGATFSESTDALDAVRAAIDALALGPGTAPDPWRYRVAGPGDAPIPGAVVTLYDPISNNPVAAARTDSLGVATLYPDPGEYVVGTARAGFVFENETVTVPEP